ncbi:MAG: gliding motility-associated C-terminal domain-containing protein, partial [Flavobacteriales bacterium]|nr:gliding motility-associated C-terminal domain-containing protein [Flavobacteriales bacterium]
SNGATTATITASTTGTYSVDVTLNGCMTSDAISVTVLSATAVDIGPDATICDGEQVTLDATTAGATYLWSTGATTPTIDVTTSGTYSVEVFVGQCSATDQATITVNTMPVVDLGPDQVFCSGETNTVLDATWPAATYLWSTGATTPTLAVSADGSYDVAVTLGNCTATDDVTIAFGSFTYSLGPDVTLCPGDEVVLGTDLPAGTSTWNGTIVSPTLVANTAGTYTLHFVAPSGCEVRDTIQVNMVALGALDLGPDATICDGESITLDATMPGASYLWEDGSSAPERSISSSGTYSVEATLNGCSVSDEITITVTPLPSFDLGPDLAICPGESITFDVGVPNGTYNWSNGSTASTLTMNSPGTAGVTVTVDGCAASDAVTVSFLDAPVIDLGPDTTLCAGATLTLNVDQPDTDFLWDDGNTSPIRVISAAGIYWVDASRNSCTQRDSIVVDVFDPSQFHLGPDRSICAGSSTTIGSPMNGASYSWSTGATTSTITVQEEGTYDVTVTIAGCVAQDAIAITEIIVAAPDLGPDRSACVGEVVMLHAAGAQISWSTGAVGPDLMVQTSGLYTATVDSLGCTATDAVYVAFAPMVTTVDLSGDAEICTGAFGMIEAAPIPGAMFTWSDGTVGDRIVVDAPGTYTVRATGMCINATESFTVEAGDCATQVHVPNAFTPNNDGINDIFLPVVDGPVDTYQLDIFDRWGERIHTTTDRYEGWDGTYEGVLSQDGVYVWKLHYRALGPEGVRNEQFIGHVTLLR